MGRSLWLYVVALLCLTNCKSSDPAGAGGSGGVGAGVAGMATVGSSGTGVAGAAGTAVGAAGSNAGSGAAGCGSESFAAIYQSIFASTTYGCNGALCHGRDPSMAASVGNLTMSSAAVAYTQLVGVASTSTICAGKTRVVRGDPTSSLLVQKLRGETVACGAPMPVNADEITDPELKRISDWIRGGACNN